MEKIIPIVMAHRREGEESGNAVPKYTVHAYETFFGELVP